MNRFLTVVVTVLYILLSSCSADPIEKLIPQSSTVGALPGITVTDITIQKGKAINGGVYVQGIIPTPYDIKKEQLKPTLIAAIKKLKYENKTCEWIGVYAQIAGGINAGRADYIKGNIQIYYDIPTEQELNDFNVEAIKMGMEPIRLPTKEEFDLAIAIDKVWQRIKMKILDIEREEALLRQKNNKPAVWTLTSEKLEGKILQMTAKEMNLPKEKVLQTKDLLRYYILSSGVENIRPQ